jgi:RNA polymerase sigma-70 factor, ECF subfamily
MQQQFDNDADLVKGLLDSAPAAFELYFHSFYPRLYRFALRRLPQPALAEEMAQEAIVKGLTNLGAFRGEASLLTWLSSICRNEIAMLKRRQPELEVLHPVVEDQPNARAVLELLADETQMPEVLARREQTISLVQSVLDCLPTPYGDLLEWKYIDGLSVAEIALRLGRTTKATESLLTRARDAFRSAVDDLFVEEADLVRP